MKKRLFRYIVIALIVAAAVCVLLNVDEILQPYRTRIDVQTYQVECLQSSPKDIIKGEDGITNDEVKAMLLSLGLEERFSTLLREQTLQAYAEADVLRVVTAMPGDGNAEKELVMFLTVADVGNHVYVSVDIEIPQRFEHQFQDVVGVAMDAYMTIDKNSYFVSVESEGREPITLVSGDDFKIKEADRGIGFIFDVSKLMKHAGDSDTPFRIHVEYKATYVEETTTLYNAYLCYEHLVAPHDGRTEVGKTSYGVCYDIKYESAIKSVRYFAVTPEPFVAYPK